MLRSKEHFSQKHSRRKCGTLESYVNAVKLDIERLLINQRFNNSALPRKIKLHKLN